MPIRSKGFNLALISAIISGFSIFVNKFALDAIKQPLVFTSVKNTGVAFLILGIILISGKWRKIGSLSRREVLYLLLIGIIGGSLPFYLFFTGLSIIPAINGAIIQKTLVIFVSLLAIPFLKEKLSFKRIFIVLILFAANILIGGFTGFKYSMGELCVLLATVFWSVEIVLAKKILPKVDPDIVTAARMGLGATILLAMSAIMQPAALTKVFSMTLNQILWLLLTITTLLAYVMTWYRALKYASAVSVTAILVASTLFTNILSAIFITHSYNFLLIVQSLLIVGGVYAIYKLENSNFQKNTPALNS